MEGEIVSNVTHALKTPLTNIQLTAETLGRGRFAGPEVIKDYANILSAESARLAQLINNLLGFARARRFGVDDLVLSDLSDLVDDELRRLQPRLDALGFVVSVDLPNALPAIRADRRGMMHALDNVFDNAIKYSPTTRSLRIRASASGQTVCLQIADDGAGIPRGGPVTDLRQVLPRLERRRGRQRARADDRGAHRTRTRRRDLSGAKHDTSGTVVTIRLPIARAS